MANDHDEPLFLCIGISLYVFVAIAIILGECLRARRPAEMKGTRPFLSRRVKKGAVKGKEKNKQKKEERQQKRQQKQQQQEETRQHWWQFWRPKPDILERHLRRLDVEAGLLNAPPNTPFTPFAPNTPSLVADVLRDGYGTFHFPGFDGFPQEAAFDQLSLGSTTACPHGRQDPKRAAPSPPTLEDKEKESFEDDFELLRKMKWNNQGKLFIVKRRVPEGAEAPKHIIKQIISSHDVTVSPEVLPHEAKMMSQAIRHSHLNIIQLQEVLTYSDRPWLTDLVIEYCNAGDLFNFIVALRDADAIPPTAFMFHFISSMIDALSFLHDGVEAYVPGREGRQQPRNCHYRLFADQPVILHRDIKPANIFLRWSDKSKYGMPDIVLGDFGLACTEDDNFGAHGTEGYWAPEVALHWNKQLIDEYACVVPDVHSPSSDMYAFGVSLYQVIFSTWKFPTVNLEERFQRIHMRRQTEVLTLLQKCLSTDPAKRLTANSKLEWAAALKDDLKFWYEKGGRLELPGNVWPDADYYENYEKEARSGTLRSSSSSSFVSEVDDMIIVSKEEQPSVPLKRHSLSFCDNPFLNNPLPSFGSEANFYEGGMSPYVLSQGPNKALTRKQQQAKESRLSPSLPQNAPQADSFIEPNRCDAMSVSAFSWLSTAMSTGA